MFRFLHAADIHLDSPLRGLERYESAPVEAVRAAPRRAFENLVDLAIEERVAFLLIAGDLYDGDWKDYNTGVFFVGEMRRLEAAGIPVHLVSGNHDAASRLTKSLRLPPNVIHYDHKKPQTTLIEELDAAIHGQSFKGRSVPDDLSVGYPPGRADRFDIGLLHTSLDGRPGHDVYAPCSVEGLREKGYDYWALGHVHRRDEVSRDPWIVFPGNLQGRHARETGPKGATLVTVDHGAVVCVEHRALDVLRWAEVEVDLSEVATADASIDAVRDALEAACDEADGRALAVRLILSGATAAHAELVQNPDRWTTEYREQASSLSAGGAGADEEAIWVEKIHFETRGLQDLAAAFEREDALGELLRAIDEVTAPSAKAADPSETPDSSATQESVASPGWESVALDLRKKLPEPLRRADSGGAEPFDPADPATLEAALAGAKALLFARLLETSGDVDADGRHRDGSQSSGSSVRSASGSPSARASGKALGG